jgi:hypothetical protein
LAAACALAAIGGACAAAALPASASSSGPSVTAFAVPSADYAAPVSSYEMPIAPAANGQGEWFVVNGDGNVPKLLLESTSGGTPSVSTTDINAGVGTNLTTALAAFGSYDLALSDVAVQEVPASGGSTLIPLGSTDNRDLAVTANGDFYLTDATDGAIEAFLSDGHGDYSQGAGGSIPNSFASQTPDAIAGAGGKLWFTTDDAELGSFNPSSNTFAGPFTTHASQLPHTLTAGADGNLWAVGGGVLAAGGSEILKINPTTGAISPYSSGLPATPGISAITSGPDGNIWFTESHADQIGELDVATGAISSYALPTGYQLPAAGMAVIAAGPSGSHTIFFGAETTGTPGPAIGEITGVGGTATTTTTPTTTTTTGKSPAPGTAKAAGKANVSSGGVAGVTLSCAGAGGAKCAGKLSLSLVVVKRVTVKVHGHKHEKDKRSTIKLGSTSYKISAGKSAILEIKLTGPGKALLRAARSGKLEVKATATPNTGKASSFLVTLIGAHKKK